MPINNALTPSGQNALGAAFGYYPQLRRNRTVQDPQSALDMPTQFLRGRLAGTLGMPSDILNMLRSPMPMEMAGETDYTAQQQVPYGTQELLKTLPLPPQGAAQQAAANVGAVIPMSPMEALQAARLARQAALAGGKGVKAVGRMAGEELNAAMFGERQGTLLGAVTPQPKFMFVGENSKTWNAGNAAKAVELEKAGAAPEDIWAATGTFRGPEGKLRQEISDKGSKITEEVFNQISTDKKFKGPMKQGLAHEELYNAYPETGQIPGLMFADITPSGNILKGKPGTFQIGQITAGGPSTMDQRSVALHELQHAIQQREGFSGGGSPKMFKPNDVFTTQALEDSAIIDKLMRGANLDQYQAQQRFETLFKRKPAAGAFAALERVGTGQELDAARDASRLADNPMESYRRLAGEAEARAVQKRRNLTDEQRLATFPYESYDLPVNQLIINK